MVQVCIVKDCLSGRDKNSSKNISFFKPSTPARLKAWGTSLKMELKSSDKICQLHFKREHIKMHEEIKVGNVVHISYYARKMLKDDAVPTIEPQFELENEPNQQEQNLEVRGLGIVEEYNNDDLQIHRNEQASQKNDAAPEYVKPIVEFKNSINKIAVLPATWFYIDKPDALEFLRIDSLNKRITNHIRLNGDLSITVVLLNGSEVSANDKILSFTDIFDYLKSVEKWPLCIGAKHRGQTHSKDCRGVIFGEDAYQRFPIHPRCKSCRIFRKHLQSYTPKTICPE